ncbi:MAG: hypothetical protein HY240_07855 [Actinobacteria bacterium]|nr:hypothetical protein [Actinomycetota bacterium]
MKVHDVHEVELSNWPEPASGARAISPSATFLTVALVLGAANVHLFLTPEHFRDGPQFGLFFLAADAFQLWLAFALLLMPSPRVYRIGLWGGAVLVATWMTTRLIPPPGAPRPEPVELWGVVATVLEIAAIVALASNLPSVGPSPSRLARRVIAAAIGAGFASLVVIASGVVTPIQAGTWSGPSFLFRIYPLPSWRLTGIWIVVAGRWSAIIPWVTIGFLALGSVLVARTVSLSLRLPAVERCSVRRHGLFAALPALATVPVCCGAPVAAVAGGVAVGALYRSTPVLMGLSLILLGLNVVLLDRRIRRSGASHRTPAAIGTREVRKVMSREPQR